MTLSKSAQKRFMWAQKTILHWATVLVIGFSLGLSAQAWATGALAPGYGELPFAAPIPGTYTLPVLGAASDGQVIDSEGRTDTLHGLMADAKQPDKVILLSFIYATCSDLNGCPLATAVFHKIKNRLQKMPEVADRVRLITLSFNPGHDTPARMKAYGASLQGKGVEWLFLTTRSERELEPILKNYQQKVEKIYDRKGKFTNTFNHGLRVYLIDPQTRIRNIYNTELLHPDTLLADIKTLLLPETTSPSIRLPASQVQANVFAAGDNKRAYENKAYETHSMALRQRQGQAADLLTPVRQPPLGLPKVPMPEDNPITAEKIGLGRKLFFDRRLSLNNTFSCAMCHIPEQGFTSNEMATAVGIEGRTVRRNSPTLYNVAYQQTLFHDSRETTLEQQVWGPLLAHNEMGNPAIGTVIEKIKHSNDYAGLFEAAFSQPPDMQAIGKAIASYERSLLSANSPFDRWYFGKDKNALAANAQRGFRLFMGKAQCSLCHAINADYALLTDNQLHNTGIGYAEAMIAKTPSQTKRVQVAPGLYADVPNTIIQSVSATKANDLGRYEITQKPQDRWLYKTPSLRNIALTAPYMHNGSMVSLREVVEFYNRGGIANGNLDPLIKPLQLSASEISDLTAFLESLTGANIDTLVSDAFAAPVGDAE